MDLPRDRLLAETEAALVDETGLNRSARLYFPPGSITRILCAPQSAGSAYYGFVIFSPDPVSVEVHILAIHFLKIISAKSITRRSLGTGKCLQRLNCVDQRCRWAPFQQIKSESVLLSGVTRGKAGMSDKGGSHELFGFAMITLISAFQEQVVFFFSAHYQCCKSSFLRDQRGWSYLLVGTRVNR